MAVRPSQNHGPIARLARKVGKTPHAMEMQHLWAGLYCRATSGRQAHELESSPSITMNSSRYLEESSLYR